MQQASSSGNGLIRVLHVIDKLSMDGVNPSSIARVLVDWNRHAASSGFDMVIVNLRYDRGCDFVQKEGAKLEWFRSGGLHLFRDARRIRELAKKYDAQILHAHGYYASYLVRMAAPRCGCKAVVHEHAVLKKKPWFWLGDWLLRKRTDMGMAVTNAVRDFMARDRCVPAEKTEIVWYGVDLDRFVIRESQERLRERFGFPPDAFMVGVASRLREEKGVQHFVRAAALIREQVPSAVFAVAGDGPQRDELHKLARSLNLNPEVFRFLGHVSDIPAFLSAVDVVVIPSLREGFGLSIIEAMACGRPVVASNVGGIPEVVGDPGNAILVPPGSPQAICEGVLRLLRDPELARTLGEKGRKNAARFSIEERTAHLGRLYRKLVDSGD